MKQSVLREVLRVDSNRRLHIEIPLDMGDEFEVIVLPIDSQPGKAFEHISDEDRFMIGAYSAVTPEDDEEDQVWGRYLNA